MKKISLLLISLVIIIVAIGQQSFRNINFRAEDANGAVRLAWTTVAETNTERYEIEKSINGIDYSVIGSITAQNNNSSPEYNFIDATPTNGVNYYRLRSVNSAGRAFYSDILRKNMGYGRTNVTVSPNPVTRGSLRLQMNNIEGGRYAIVIYNMAGNQVYNQSLTLSQGTSAQLISLPSNISRGMYVLQLVNNDSRVNKQFVIN